MMDYKEYLQSTEWKQRVDIAKYLAGYRCQVCNSPKELNAHHRTYERLGNELPSDIIVLCRECHELFHVKRELYQEEARIEKNSRQAELRRTIPEEYRDIIKRG